ncbi:hypothetical protein NPX13_g8621 [Xylaria arbuscula]|uniref:C2H2-type domain-containing protein n=1 Tax=Xylaria arbuscula TaxID=114810 RepID=A0A9W8N8C0_9PEZI|nr:hypothetical protein NPX13_g8621 [Xylaria arbuscula]
MSEYIDYFDFDAFDALVAPNENTFDFNFDDIAPPIGQDEGSAYADNAPFAFDPPIDFGAGSGLDFDFNADFHYEPPQPLLPDVTGAAGQSLRCAPVGVLPPASATMLVNQDLLSHRSSEALFPPSPNFVSSGPISPRNQSLEFGCDFRWEPGHDVPARTCGVFDCTSSFNCWSTLRAHRISPHSPRHHLVWNDSAISCAECGEISKDESELVSHAKNKKHSPYACSCGVKFARINVLNRHVRSFLKESAKYQCTFCKRHRGKNAFRRRDHLVQHLRGYHKMDPEEINDVSPTSRVQSRWIPCCPHPNCAAYRDDDFKALPWEEQFEGMPFQKQSDYNRHMREVHEESSFSCSVDGCDRVGAKGYMREKDLMKHLADKHPEAPSYNYVPTTPTTYDCGRCGVEFSNLAALQYHEDYFCEGLRHKRDNK